VRSPADLTEAFRQRRLKVTPQRQLLFRLLHENPSHPTAEALFVAASQQMPGISLRTVYQTLNDLASMGEIGVVNVGAGSTRFDPNISRHHHALCDACGELRDVYVEGVDALHVKGLDGFDPRSATIVFGGLCAACAAPIPATHQSTKGARP